MKLFEIASGGTEEVLRILQAQAKDAKEPTTVPFSSFMRMIDPFNLGVSTPDGVRALLIGTGGLDKDRKVVKNVTDQGDIILKTGLPGDDEQDPDAGRAPNTPTIDAMASRNAKKLTPDI
jgi:hypothetical protein